MSARPIFALGALLLAGICLLPGLYGGEAKFNRAVRIGQVAPAITSLAGVDGKSHALEDYRDSKVVVLVFMSNRCPVARAYEQRMVALARELRDKQVQFLAINCGRTRVDSLTAMQSRSQQGEYPFPYLKDADMQIGKLYGALATPNLFVLDAQRRIVYMGAFDDSVKAEEVTREYVRLAVEAALAGKTPEVAESLPRGCPIDYGDDEADDE